MEEGDANAVTTVAVQLSEPDTGFEVCVRGGIPATSGPNEMSGWIGRHKHSPIGSSGMGRFLETLCPRWIAIEPVIAIADPELGRAGYTRAIVRKRCEI